MAGESPDRSKQHEASAEPTSGSAGTVPAAREADSAAPAEVTAGPAAPVEDEELREAVSAWVRSADDASASGGSAKGKPSAKGGSGTAGSSGGPEEDAAPAEGDGADDDSDEGESAPAKAVVPSGGSDTEAPEADAVEDAPAGAEDAPEEGSGTPEAEDGSEGAEKAASGSEDASDDASGDSGAEEAPEAPVAAHEDTDGDAAPEDAPEGASGSAADTVEDSEGDAEEGDAGSSDEAKSETGSEAEAEAAPEADADADADSDAEDSAKDVPAPAAKDSEDSKDSEKRTPLPAAEDDAESDTESDGDDTGESGEDTPADAVDHPTTVFKAPRPKKPEVDQPTTMLKLGGKPKPAPAKPSPAERDAERTSRFVALKPDLKAPSPRAEETRAVPQVGPERTTQQPLPPKPPLDLLAELTNTPPPPETPVRTLVRRVKIWTPLVILLVVILGVVQATRALPQPTLALTAEDSHTFGGGKADIPWPADGQAALDVQGIGSFGSSGSGKPVPIASVAKVMTAYLILRDHPLKSGAEGPKIKIDKAAQDQSRAGQESTVDVTEGDAITQREALEGVLIASANNVARLLARWDAGSEKAFVAKMNDAAKGLGMSGTTYTDPSGLTNSTVSTAADQVKLAKAAMRMPAFREVAAMMSYTDYKGTYHSNWNQLVGHNGVVGIKTGTTTSALGNLVFAAKQDVDGETRMIIGAVLRQPPGGRENTILSAALDHSDALIRAAQGALKSETLLKKGTVVGYVDDGLGGRTPVEVTEDVKAAGWAGLKVRLSFDSDTVPHTAKAGTQVGSLTVGDGTAAGAVKVPVALRDDLAEPGLGSKLTRLG
ncbi:D-alanyl-D-alanine carboxypeptidase [Streptomyces sp. NPDC046860]|uniref:D-alanyl-D-alanine carboxypeptidase n=1 Tax=Streptomyces sp. NPDC046860 TaxID=3154495 RepID=UPI0033D16406